MNKLHWTPPSEPVAGVGPPFGFRVMENTTTRNAYWCSWIEKGQASKWYAVWWYGRIGTFGKKGYREFNGEISAHAWLNAKRTEKVAGDYVTVLDNQHALPAASPAKNEPKAKKHILMPSSQPEVVPYTTSESAKEPPKPTPAQSVAQDEFDPLEALWS